MKVNGSIAKIMGMLSKAKQTVREGLNTVTKAAEDTTQGAVNNLVEAEQAKAGTLNVMLGNPNTSTQERILIMEALKRVSEQKAVQSKGTQKPPALKIDPDRTPSGNHTRRAA